MFGSFHQFLLFVRALKFVLDEKAWFFSERNIVAAGMALEEDLAHRMPYLRELPKGVAVIALVVLINM